MPKTSAGLMMYRRKDGELEVLLVHLGGPFWAKKDAGSWTFPRGEVAEHEDPLDAARREFQEETGISEDGLLVALGQVKHRSGKVVYAWAFEGDCDPAAIKSNTFEIEWPPKSGKRQSFPEIDRAAFFSIDEAKEKIFPTELPFLETLAKTE